MKTFEILGREIPLLFNVGVWGDIEEQVCPMAELEDHMTGKKRIGTVIKMAVIMGNAALVEQGKKPVLTEAWLKKNLPPKAITDAQMAIMEAISEAMMTENVQKEDQEIDLVLQELEKKADKV